MSPVSGSLDASRRSRASSNSASAASMPARVELDHALHRVARRESDVAALGRAGQRRQLRLRLGEQAASLGRRSDVAARVRRRAAASMFAASSGRPASR